MSAYAPGPWFFLKIDPVTEVIYLYCGYGLGWLVHKDCGGKVKI